LHIQEEANATMARVGTTRLAPGLATIVLILGSPGLRAENEPAVARGVQYLRGHAEGMEYGEMALAALGMLKADVPAGDPTVTACITKIRQRFTSDGFRSEEAGGKDIYVAAVVAMVLANLDADSRRAELGLVARYLISRQKANGSWDYDHRTSGDTSISQYAILGLWEASNSGADVPPSVFDRAAYWFMSTQGAGGGWAYHRDENGPDTLSMTAAGVGSLLICQRQLALYRELSRGEAPSIS